MSVRTVRKESERKELEKEMLQKLLMSLLRDEENRYCADCEAKGPRWASWNIGVFVCIRCAGIHRKLGVHISKVKSINLDAWTPEQVASMCCIGNSVAKAVYEHSLPEHFRRPQSDQALEAFIRAKYEQKRYIMRDWQRPEPNIKNLPCYEELMELRNHGTVRTRPNATTATVSGGSAHVTLPPPTMSTKPAAAAPPHSVTSAPNLLDLSTASSAATTTTQSAAPSNMNDLLGLNSEPAPRPQEQPKATNDLEDLFGDFAAPQTSPSTVSDNNRAFDQKLSQIYELCKTEPQRPMPMNGFNMQPQMPMSGLTAQMQGMTMQQPFAGGAPMMAPTMSMQQPHYAAQQPHPMAQAQNMQRMRPQQPQQSVQDIMSNPFFSQLNAPHSTAPPKAQATSDNNNTLADLFG